MKGKRRFAWINKDAANLTSRDHINKVNSHLVQVNWDVRKRDQERQDRQQRSTQETLLPWHQVPNSQVFLNDEENSEYNGVDPASGRNATTFKPTLGHVSNNPASDSSLHEQLDPFMSLAGPTTLRERSLLHYYLSVTPTTVYGTHSASLYCPVRDRTVIFVQNNCVWLPWVLLSAEVYLLGARAAEKSISVLSRRTALYHSIRKMVSNPATCLSDSTVSHITLAAVVENRIGARVESQKHLAAAKCLIKKRGDRLERLPLNTVSTFIWIGTGIDAFADFEVLEASITSITQAMLDFQEWRPDLLEDSQKISRAATAVQSSSGALLGEYVQSRRQAFGRQSPLRPFVEAEFHDQNLSQRRSHMAILWILNRILWDLRGSYEESINFLDSLHHLVESAGFVSLKCVTMLFMIAECVARIGVQQTKQNHNTTDIMLGRDYGDCRVRWWWEAVDVVESLLLLTETTRGRIQLLLSTCLLEASPKKAALTPSSLGDISDEMRLGWHTARQNPTYGT